MVARLGGYDSEWKYYKIETIDEIVQFYNISWGDNLPSGVTRAPVPPRILHNF